MSAINKLQRVSKPGLRKYVNVEQMPVLNGLGIAIISTSRMMTDKEAKPKTLVEKFYVTLVKNKEREYVKNWKIANHAPKGVEISRDEKTNIVTVKGSLGELKQYVDGGY